MSETKHNTTGPWDLAAGSFLISGGTGSQRVQAIYQHNKIRNILAFVPSDIEDDGATNQEQKANAALIAASPELWERLADLVEWLLNVPMEHDVEQFPEVSNAKVLLTKLRNAGV